MEAFSLMQTEIKIIVSYLGGFAIYIVRFAEYLSSLNSLKGLLKF